MTIETLRPNAAGDETSIASQFPDSTFHWDKVDDVSSDGDDTYIFTQSTSYQRDLYNLPAHSVGSGTINFIRIRALIRTTSAGVLAYVKVSQKSGAVVTDGVQASNNAETYYARTQDYATNPATGSPYTWEEIDALQIGLQLKIANSDYEARATQVQVEVHYTIPVGRAQGHIFG